LLFIYSPQGRCISLINPDTLPTFGTGQVHYRDSCLYCCFGRQARLNDVVGQARLNDVVGQARLNDVVGQARLNDVVGQARLNDVVGQARLNDVVGQAFNL